MNFRDTNNTLVRFFAKRYLFSKKSHTLINVISIVSSLSVAVPVAALIILLSVFGGLNSLMESLNSNFDAQLKITPVEGRFFSSDELTSKIEVIGGVETITSFLEDNALARYKDAQTLVTVRGVDTLYNKVVPISNMVTVGNYSLGLGDLQYAVVGMGVAYNLGINVNLSQPLHLFVPTTERTSFIPTPSYKAKDIFPTSIFVIDAETDGSYIVVPLDFARELFSRANQVSAIGIKISEGANINTIKAEIEKVVGSKYKVQTRYQQKQTVYEIMQSEKRIIFLISLLVIIVASFTLTGSLIMLMADKRSQINILSVMGAKERFIDKIFLFQGAYISLAGIIGGVVVGSLLTIAQQYIGFIKIESQTLLIDTYPVLLS
ncbi:MAG: FtsX-like permease family protein, partial [Rikenellaceae bacterium]